VSVIGIDSLGVDLRVSCGIEVQTLRFQFARRVCICASLLYVFHGEQFLMHCAKFHFLVGLLCYYSDLRVIVQATSEKNAEQLLDQLINPRFSHKRPRKSQQPPRRWTNGTGNILSFRLSAIIDTILKIGLCTLQLLTFTRKSTSFFLRVCWMACQTSNHCRLSAIAAIKKAQ
jgi:hypothetical protein